MRPRLLLLIGIWFVVSPAAAQPDAFERAKVEPGPPGLFTLSVVSAREEMRRVWRVTSFYAGWETRAGGAPRLVWLARRISRDRFDSDALSTNWANSSDCPSLTRELTRLQEVPAPVPPGPKDGGLPPPPPSDGVTYELRTTSARYAGSGDLGALTMGGNLGSSLGLWEEAMQKALAGCWRPAPPKLARR